MLSEKEIMTAHDILMALFMPGVEREIGPEKAAGTKGAISALRWVMAKDPQHSAGFESVLVAMRACAEGMGYALGPRETPPGTTLQ
jgi:hypothetical protein